MKAHGNYAFILEKGTVANNHLQAILISWNCLWTSDLGQKYFIYNILTQTTLKKE
jgi:hypothetical protein